MHKTGTRSQKDGRKGDKMKNYELFKATLKSDLEKAFAEGDISVEIEERKIEKLNKSYEALSLTSPTPKDVGF